MRAQSYQPITYVGIDYDTFAIHLVRLPVTYHDGLQVYGQPTYHLCRLEGHDAFSRMRRVPWELPGEGFWDDVVAVGIEEPGGKYSVAKLKGIQGAIVACLPLELLIAEYQAGLWRKLCGLSGRSTKEEVMAWVYGQLGENPQWPQDACDAYCLARAVASQVTRG